VPITAHPAKEQDRDQQNEEQRRNGVAETAKQYGEEQYE
jgi:hypothetical protein